MDCVAFSDLPLWVHRHHHCLGIKMRLILDEPDACYRGNKLNCIIYLGIRSHILAKFWCQFESPCIAPQWGSTKSWYVCNSSSQRELIWVYMEISSCDMSRLENSKEHILHPFLINAHPSSLGLCCFYSWIEQCDFQNQCGYTGTKLM